MVCKEEDDFVFEQPRWIAHLSNGEKIIQDDNRPGVEPPQAWLRLAEYCKQEKVDIVNLTLQFRSNHVAPLPANAEGYYFINGVGKVWMGPSLQYFVIGYLQDGKIEVQKWKIPELVLIGTETRSLENSDLLLIRRNNEASNKEL